jgi:hypothetical protein
MVKTELADKDDKLIEGAWNSTTRTIKINHDAPADMASAHGDHGAQAGDAGAPKEAPKDAGAAPKAKPTTAAPPPTMTQNLPSMGPSPGSGAGTK